ncbi:Uncharacterised protein [Mycobacteroides abscessus subsp. abscessus]|nr:Uncharacterised protein [Mycobacteroides abscessus subsp. abscessus]
MFPPSVDRDGRNVRACTNTYRRFPEIRAAEGLASFAIIGPSVEAGPTALLPRGFSRTPESEAPPPSLGVPRNDEGGTSDHLDKLLADSPNPHVTLAAEGNLRRYSKHQILDNRRCGVRGSSYGYSKPSVEVYAEGLISWSLSIVGGCP